MNLTDHTNELISYFQQLEMHNNEVKRVSALVDQKYNEIKAFLGTPAVQAALPVVEKAVETALPEVTPVVDLVNDVAQVL